MNSLWPTISVLLLQRVLQQEQPPTTPGPSGEFQTGAIWGVSHRRLCKFG